MALETSMNAAKRRLVYGANVAVTALLATAVVAFILWGSGRVGGRIDLTRSGLNSLSGRTKNLLHGLEQDVTITGLYSTALKEIRPHAQKHHDRLADLLDLYETEGRGKITARMIDPSKDPALVTELLERLREKPAYQDEAKRHKALIERFPAVQTAVNNLMSNDVAQLEELAKQDERLDRVMQLARYAMNLRAVGREAENTTRTIETLQDEEVPRYGRAVEAVEGFLSLAQSTLQDGGTWMSTSGVSLPGISPEALQFFTDSTQAHEPVLEQIAEALALARALKNEKLELESTYETLKRGQNVLIETPTEARVVEESKVFTRRSDANAPLPEDGDTTEFAGEQAISSGILQLVQKEKTALVFTHFGGTPPLKPDFSNFNMQMRQMPRAPYGVLNELLGEENFTAEEWDVSKLPAPPQIPDAGRTIYVVFPPTPPPRPNPMQPAAQAGMTPAQRQAVLDAVDAAGMAIFLAGWTQPQGGMPFSTGGYEYGEYLEKTWGIKVRDKHLAITFVSMQENPGLWSPAGRTLAAAAILPLPTDLTRFSEHELVKPLQSQSGAFLMACPLELIAGENKPAGVTVEALAAVEPTERIWALDNVMRLTSDMQQKRGTQRYESDIAAPFPIAAAAWDEQGKKVVVFTGERFVVDEMLRAQGYQLVAGGLRSYLLYPANSDLFINTLHWLTGDADRISVGPQRGGVPRLDKLEPGATEKFCKVFIVGIWPAVALLAGGGVWLLRRR